MHPRWVVLAQGHSRPTKEVVVNSWVRAVISENSTGVEGSASKLTHVAVGRLQVF